MNECCPFCRAPHPYSDEEARKRYRKRMDLNDAEAFCTLAMQHREGGYGLPRDENTIADLLKGGAELGSPEAHYHLAASYHRGEGVEQDINKAFHHWKVAAIGGHEIARHLLGGMELEQNGNIDRAMKHFMISAKCGSDDSMKAVGKGYKTGHVTKDEYASTLRAHQFSVDEMKNESRDKPVAFRRNMESGS